jgi:hypothetical protein
MPTYTVNHAYRALRDGAVFGPYEPGTTVELSDADAEWVNRDSPGCLTEAATAKAKAEPEGATVGANDRQHKGGRRRAGG